MCHCVENIVRKIEKVRQISTAISTRKQQHKLDFFLKFLTIGKDQKKIKRNERQIIKDKLFQRLEVPNPHTSSKG